MVHFSTVGLIIMIDFILMMNGVLCLLMIKVRKKQMDVVKISITRETWQIKVK